MNWFAVVCAASTPVCYWLSRWFFQRQIDGALFDNEMGAARARRILAEGGVLRDTDGNPVAYTPGPVNAAPRVFTAEEERHWEALDAELGALDKRIMDIHTNSAARHHNGDVVQLLTARRHEVWEQAKALLDRAEHGKPVVLPKGWEYHQVIDTPRMTATLFTSESVQ